MAFEEFDVFVIGTGNAGKNVAFACAEAGMRVAIADNREFGGTCANRGCDPKKVIVEFTAILQQARNLTGKGIVAPPEIDWKALQKFKENFTSAVPYVNERRLTQAGITLYHQSPRFLDKNHLSVEGKTVVVRKVVIATGLVPRELKIQGREHLKVSDDFLDLEGIPEEIVFVGAGYIGMEFAHIAARLGSKVTVIEFADQPLDKMDPDIVRHLTEESERIGIQFIFNAAVTEVEKLKKNYKVHYKEGDDVKSLITQMVFNTAGRMPSIDQLNLEKGNVAYDRHGITVNEYLQSTTHPEVYACGDVSGSGLLPLTPTSHLESHIVIANILNGNTRQLEHPLIPTVTYTIPQVATVGMTEEQAKAAGHEFEVKYENVPQWYSAKHRNDSVYAFKTLVDKKDNVILGVHLIASEAGELINLFTVVMNQKMTTDQLKKTVFAYPTWGNDIKRMV